MRSRGWCGAAKLSLLYVGVQANSRRSASASSAYHRYRAIDSLSEGPGLVPNILLNASTDPFDYLVKTSK